jgi:hypothetical protein
VAYSPWRRILAGGIARPQGRTCLFRAVPRFAGAHLPRWICNVRLIAGSGTAVPLAHHHSVRPVVATFASRADIMRFADQLRSRLGLPATAVSMAIVAAYGEPHDAHQLLVAWVPDDREAEATAMVVARGGTLQPQPWH